MRAWVRRRTYDTSVSSSRHSACIDRRSSTERAVEADQVAGVEHTCAPTCGRSCGVSSWEPRYQRHSRAESARRLSSPRI